MLNVSRKRELGTSAKTAPADLLLVPVVWSCYVITVLRFFYSSNITAMFGRFPTSNKVSEATMPTRILIIGLLFCLGGGFSLWEVVSDFYQTHVIRLDPTVLLLPVGIGLLRGKASSRAWARVWIILGLAGAAVSLVFTLLFPRGDAEIVAFGYELATGKKTIPYVIAATVLLCLIHRMLYSPKADLYFNVNSEQEVAPVD